MSVKQSLKIADFSTFRITPKFDTSLLKRDLISFGAVEEDEEVSSTELFEVALNNLFSAKMVLKGENKGVVQNLHLYPFVSDVKFIESVSENSLEVEFENVAMLNEIKKEHHFLNEMVIVVDAGEISFFDGDLLLVTFPSETLD